jgi:hypothetical protein
MAVGYAQVIKGDTPASYWRLGELTTGSSAADAVGTVTGTYNGGSILGVPGAVQGDNDTCVYFNGTGYVGMGNTYIMGGTSAFSIEAWVQLQAFGSNLVAFIAGNYWSNGSGDQGWGLSIQNNGLIEFFRILNGTYQGPSTAVNTMPLGQWVHLVGTYDGATMTLYMNGQSVGSAASTQSVSTTGNGFRIASNNGGSNMWNGMIDEVAVYNYALTAAKVLAHYQAARFTSNAPTYLAAISGGTQVAQSGQINQSLGLHAQSIINTGALQVGLAGASASPGTTWSLNGQWLDQPFTMPAHLDTIDRIEIALQCLGTGADITATLRPDSSGVPSATILSQVTIPAQFLPTGRSRMVSLPLQASGLSMSGIYHLVLQAGGTSGNTLVAPQGGSGLGTLQTSTNGTAWTAHSGVQLIAGIYQGDAPPVRNVREGPTAWCELENDAAGHLVGTYEMIQGARTVHRIAYSGYGRMLQVI